MEQHLNPPAKGLVLEIGSGDNPNPRADILVDKFLFDNTERGGNIVIDRPIVVADAHHLPFKDGVFAYTICSHILEHMDDPLQFVSELTRVSHAGYIQSPSEIAERTFHWSFHRWYVNLIGDTIILHPREPEEPFGEFFDYLYAYNPAYYLFQRSMPHLFWVEKEWHGTLKVEVHDKSPLNFHDPDQLKALVAPRMGTLRLIGLLIASDIGRRIPASWRARVRRLLGRSYL
ncbi:MAG: methyltransferase domain-containing protein [Chloroflexi bacterium]|jgi:SAM-dependent methyltransferase|nr:MAG: methyltransferase domain-containing protein [Chloroflexota bacterium]